TSVSPVGWSFCPASIWRHVGFETRARRDASFFDRPSRRRCSPMYWPTDIQSTASDCSLFDGTATMRPTFPRGHALCVSILLESSSFYKHSHTLRRAQPCFASFGLISTKFLSMWCEVRIIVVWQWRCGELVSESQLSPDGRRAVGLGGAATRRWTAPA